MQDDRVDDEPTQNDPELNALGGDDDEDPDDEFLDPRERQRMRRRDHDAGAQSRDLLRPGMGKVFKQIQDAQRRDADDDAPGHRKRKHR